jgi:hypothetical protein
MVNTEGNILPTKSLGIVDSGCDSTTFPIEWAERLGIDAAADCVPQECSTAGGPITQFAYAPGVYVLFLGKKLHLTATFAPACPHVLLGREDFFMYFKSVNFQQDRQKLVLEAVPDWEAAVKTAEQNVQGIGAAIEAQAQEAAEVEAAAASAS